MALCAPANPKWPKCIDLCWTRLDGLRKYSLFRVRVSSDQCEHLALRSVFIINTLKRRRLFTKEAAKKLPIPDILKERWTHIKHISKQSMPKFCSLKLTCLPRHYLQLSYITTLNRLNFAVPTNHRILSRHARRPFYHLASLWYKFGN